MSNDRTSPISVPNSENRHRRGSIADIFSKSSNTNQASQSNQANQRRLSISTLGLSGSPTQTAFGNQNFRRGSISSSLGSVPNTDDAIAEDAEESPNSQFARRVSFGAQALRDARGSTGNGEGFNWSEALRSRAERAPSLGAPVSPQAQQRQSGYHQRAASIASMEQPGREMPRQAKQNKPDFFQEKILRGDFMD